MQLDECVALPASFRDRSAVVRVARLVRASQGRSRDTGITPRKPGMPCSHRQGARSLRRHSADSWSPDLPAKLSRASVGTQDSCSRAGSRRAPPSGKPRYLMGVGTPQPHRGRRPRRRHVLLRVPPPRAATASIHLGCKLNMRNAVRGDDTPSIRKARSGGSALSRAYIPTREIVGVSGSMLLSWPTPFYQKVMQACCGMPSTASLNVRHPSSALSDEST